jgi:hypothetical protein
LILILEVTYFIKMGIVLILILIRGQKRSFSKGGEHSISLQDINDEILIKVYHDAIKYQLDEEFIKILINEIERRDLKV